MTGRLNGLRRYASWSPYTAEARCYNDGCWWRTTGSYPGVTKAARQHTRDTGHPTRAKAVRVIDYSQG